LRPALLKQAEALMSFRTSILPLLPGLFCLYIVDMCSKRFVVRRMAVRIDVTKRVVVNVLVLI